MTDTPSPSPQPAAPTRAMKPQDAASLIIVDRRSGEPRVLMGRRRMDQVFMPGKYVFPGGRVDAADRLVPSADELRPVETAKLLLKMKGAVSDSRARTLALAAVRETFEEAGLVIGRRSEPVPETKVDGWRAFVALGFLPALAALTFVARAITPPGRPRRYDTRFFCIEAQAIAHRVELADGELSDTNWFTVEEALGLDLSAITSAILGDLTDRLKAGPLASAEAPVPYYHHVNGSFRREMLTLPVGSGSTAP